MLHSIVWCLGWSTAQLQLTRPHTFHDQGSVTHQVHESQIGHLKPAGRQGATEGIVRQPQSRQTGKSSKTRRQRSTYCVACTTRMEVSRALEAPPEVFVHAGQYKLIDAEGRAAEPRVVEGHKSLEHWTAPF